MNFLPLLEAKRNGDALSKTQIGDIIAGIVSGDIPDYQISAWLMAVYFRGLTDDEVRDLTLAMRDSGDVLHFEDDGRPVVDKHSTGGVGDKVSLPLAPLLACLGFRVPMISGRGLGITGGTLDKLESIPGFSTSHPKERITEMVQQVGLCMAAQSANMVPADKKLYALRDVTATVPSINLITASILSKKLAEGLESLILDVKWGRAAFMQTKEEAEKLAAAMCTLGTACGVKTEAFLSDMNAPLGETAGNWLEVLESVDILEGRGPADTVDVVLTCASRLLEMTGKAATTEEGRRIAKDCLASGAPREKWNEMLVAQGADLAAFEAKLKAPCPVFETAIPSPVSGIIQDLDARVIGEIVRDLGGGRLRQDSILNLEVGFHSMRKPGEKVEAGEPLAMMRAVDSDVAAGVIMAQRAWHFEA
ncbi:thymidine phosphorylase [bacterium]|nr:MAG: thymidine phosphorylase [bacterium]